MTGSSARLRIALLTTVFVVLVLLLPFWLARENRVNHQPLHAADRRGANARLELAGGQETSAGDLSTEPREPTRTAAANAMPPKGEIPAQYVMAAHDARAFDAILAWARANGIAVNGTVPGLNAISLTIRNPQQLQALRDAVPGITIEPNVWIYAPDIPGTGTAPLDSTGVAFRNRALEWLGVSTDDPNRGTGVRIALLDTTVLDHPALAGARITRLSVGDVPFPDIDGDYRGHGTAVASLLVCTPESVVPGIAPNAELIAIEVLDANGVGNAFDLAQGILLALDRGATIINMSLGTYSDSAIVRQAVDLALSQGVLVVAAAGNEGVEGLNYPAAYPGVIAVSAVDARGERAEYANTDPALDIAAPGVGIYAAWENGGLISFSGTSAATPFVAGALAMLLGSNAEVSPDDAMDLIVDYADDNGAPGPDPAYGAGTLNVGRVLERNQTGIVDAALSSHYLDSEAEIDGVIPLLVNAQNRGTEYIAKLEVTMTANGKTTLTTFEDVQVGETVTVELPIDTTQLQTDGALSLDTRVRIPGLESDAIPENDSRTSRIYLTAPAEDARQ